MNIVEIVEIKDINNYVITDKFIFNFVYLGIF